MPGAPARPVPPPALLASPALQRPSWDPLRENKRLKLPRKQIPWACRSNQTPMTMARPGGQSRRRSGVGSPGRGPSEVGALWASGLGLSLSHLLELRGPGAYWLGRPSPHHTSAPPWGLGSFLPLCWLGCNLPPPGPPPVTRFLFIVKTPLKQHSYFNNLKGVFKRETKSSIHSPLLTKLFYLSFSFPSSQGS